MKRLLLLFAFLSPMLAHGQLTTITATNISNVAGQKFTGQWCAQPAQQFVAGGGGNVSTQQVCFSVTNGVLQSGAVLYDTSLTNPANVCYVISLVNSFGQSVASYSCMQPSGSTYSFDSFVQASPPPAITAYSIPVFETNGVTNSIQNSLNLAGPGVSYANGTVMFVGGSGGMTWPGTAGIAVYAGSDAWGTSLVAPTGTIVGTTDTQSLTNKTLDGVTPTTMGYMDATSSIQTQLNAKQPALGYTPTNAAIVPSTAPTAGQVLVGNSGGTAYAPVAMGGDCTLASTGAVTCTKSNGTSFGTAAFDAATAFDPAGAAATAQSNAEAYSSNASNITSGTVAVANGGTGSTTVSGALTNLGIQPYGTLTSGNLCSYVAGTGIVCNSPGVSSSWSSLAVPTANTVLAMGGYTTEFDTPGATDRFFVWANTTPATSTLAQSSPIIYLCARGWEGSTPADSQDCSTFQQVVPNGANPLPGLTIGSTTSSTNGSYAINLPAYTKLNVRGGILSLGGPNTVAVYGTSNGDDFDVWTGAVNAAPVVQFGSSTNNSYDYYKFGGNYSVGHQYVTITAQNATRSAEIAINGDITASGTIPNGSVVKIATTASQVVVATTSDTGPGAALGFWDNGGMVMPGSIIVDPVMGTGTCAIGQFVVVDTTTNGDVKCTSTYTAGTILGKALTAQTTVGGAVTVYVQPM